MKDSMAGEIRNKSNMFVGMFCFAGISTTTLFPLCRVAFPEDGLSWAVNPYLPHLFYQPFDTTSILGAAIGWTLGSLKFFFMYTINCTVNWYYISGVVQMKVHFRLLNHSITNIHRRALKMFSTSRSRVCPAQLLDDRHFQKCLYISLRSCIQHHQALLRFNQSFQPFSGAFTLCVIILAPVVYGCQLYLLTQPNRVDLMVSLVLTFSAEMFTVIFICFLSQEVYTESEAMFLRLYSIGWFKYNKSFNQMLQIMLSFSLRPMGVKALLLGMPASLQTYGSIMAAMYKVTSLVRQSDLV